MIIKGSFHSYPAARNATAREIEKRNGGGS